MNKEIINQPRAIVHSFLLGLSGTPLSIGASLFIDMKTIKLTQGKVALIDNEDYDKIIQLKWFAQKASNNNFYAINRGRGPHRTRKFIAMHRFILNAPFKLQVDHIDHNGLNNQKSNLRICTCQQNQTNKTAFGKSKYRGVFFDEGRIRCAIKINGKYTYLKGPFKTEEDAANAYDALAKIHHGEFANLNFKSF
jgi:hypothetical protein